MIVSLRTRLFLAVVLPVTLVEILVLAFGQLRGDIIEGSLPLFVTAVGASWWFASREDRRMRRMADAALRMASGDFNIQLPDHRGDDVSRLAQSLNRLADASASTFHRLEAESRLVRSIIETMREGVMAVDQDGRITLVNDAMLRLTGHRGAAAGLSPAEVILAPELLQAIREVLEGNPVSREISVTRPLPATLLVNGAPLADGEGALAVVHDTTELHRLHQMRRDFVANVSHELRNPVATIQAAVETLASFTEETQAGDDERRLLATVSRQTARMAALVRDLLGLARIESGQLVLEPRTTDLGDLVPGIMAAFEAQARDKGLTLDLTVDSDTPPGLCDASALHTVIGNLLDNAVKYARPGDRISVHARLDGPARVAIEVSDTGPGIAEEHLPRLFERFYRVDAGRSRELGGTGLGLAIVKHLCAAMGGTVSVKSAVGTGTTFTVQLPADPEPPHN
jgi:two-component system phosphate regulon sensor histidine kinase PhoR